MAARKGVKWTPEQKAKWYAARWGGRKGPSRNEFDRAKSAYTGKHLKALNGTFDQVLGALRTERVTAEQRVSQLTSAIQAMEAIER